MRGLKTELEKDIKHGKQLLERYRKELTELPRGSMSCYRKKGRIYYKYVIYGSGGVRVERHLGKNDGELIYAMQRKAYIKEVIRRIEKNLKAVQKAAGKYEAYDYYSIWAALGDAYQVSNVARFLGQEGIEMKHIGSEGQTYRTETLRQNTTGGFQVRSKGETLIAEALMARNIVFQFEKEFKVKLAGGQVITLHPDFRIPKRDGSVLLWEHLGRLNDRGYALDAGDRLFLYNQAGYYPGINLILTADDRNGYTDTKAVAQILDWVETLCLFEN